MMDLFVFQGQENSDLLHQVEKFRVAVWSNIIDPEVAKSHFSIDEFDSLASHVIMLEGGVIVASARLVITTSVLEIPDICSFKPYTDLIHYPVAFVNRLAVHEAHRSEGLAKLLNQKRDELAKINQVNEIWIEAQRHREATLMQRGYFYIGPSADETVAGDWMVYCKKMECGR